MKYCIGDIHANYNALKCLFNCLNLKSGDELVFLGDYVDKNKETEEVVSFLLNLEKQYSCTFIKGNHEFVWERYLLFGETERQEFLLNYGGVQTLMGYTDQAESLIRNNDIAGIKKYLQSYLTLVSKSKDYYASGEYLMLHAGLTEAQLSKDPITWTESNYFIRPAQINMSKRYMNRYTIVAGHTYLNDEPTCEQGYINIDLGAGYGKFLGAFCLDTRTVIRSDGKLFICA